MDKFYHVFSSCRSTCPSSPAELGQGTRTSAGCLLTIRLGLLPETRRSLEVNLSPGASKSTPLPTALSVHSASLDVLDLYPSMYEKVTRAQLQIQGQRAYNRRTPTVRRLRFFSARSSLACCAVWIFYCLTRVLKLGCTLSDDCSPVALKLFCKNWTLCSCWLADVKSVFLYCARVL